MKSVISPSMRICGMLKLGETTSLSSTLSYENQRQGEHQQKILRSQKFVIHVKHNPKIPAFPSAYVEFKSLKLRKAHHFLLFHIKK